MANIFVFRTGSIETKQNIFCGWLNIQLSKQGIKEAQQIAKKLKNQKIDFALCSDQLRSKQALAEVLQFHKNTKVIMDHRLRERNYGVFSGHEKELFKKYYPEKYKEIHRHYYADIPKGENFEQLSRRIFSFMNDLLKFMKETEGNIVICAHTNSMRLIIEFLEDLNKQNVSEIEHSPTQHKNYFVKFN